MANRSNRRRQNPQMSRCVKHVEAIGSRRANSPSWPCIESMPKSEAEYTCAVSTGAKAKGLAMRRSPYTDLQAWSLPTIHLGEVMSTEDRLKQPVITTLAKIAANRCANPECRAVTSGPTVEPNGFVMGGRPRICGNGAREFVFTVHKTSRRRSSLML